MYRLLPLLAALTLFGFGPLRAQPGSFSPVPGFDGCEGSNGVPHLDAVVNNVPRINRFFGLHVTNIPAPGGTLHFVLGFSDKTWLGLPLPVALANAGLWNCTLWQSVDFVLPAFNPNPTTEQVYSFRLPNDTNLIGLEFWVQALVEDFFQTLRPAGYSVSNSAKGVIGS